MAEKAITWYNRLKEAINGQIKQNGKREITGAKLNSVLNQMVDALGKNMTFGGEVNPATVIDNTDDNPVFYLALEAGNYPYCGNIVVGQGQIAFLFRDANNIWHQASWNASDENFTTEEKEKLQGLPTQEELRDALGAKANAPESKPGSDNLASFDENGNLKDSGVSIPVPTEEEKEHVLSSGETGLEWVPKPADGKSALDIYNELNPNAQLDKAGFISKLQQKYPMKPVAYYDESAIKTIGTPFTSALDNNNLFPTPDTMGILYIMPNSNTNPTGSIAFTTINTGENLYAWVNLGAVDIPNNVVTDDRIDGTHLENPTANSVAKASDCADIKKRLDETETIDILTLNEVTDERYWDKDAVLQSSPRYKRLKRVDISSFRTLELYAFVDGEAAISICNENSEVIWQRKAGENPPNNINFIVLADLPNPKFLYFCTKKNVVDNWYARGTKNVYTYEDLKQDVIENKNAITPLQNDVSQLNSDVTDLQNDVTDLQNDVTDLQNDVTDLRYDEGQSLVASASPNGFYEVDLTFRPGSTTWNGRIYEITQEQKTNNAGLVVNAAPRDAAYVSLVNEDNANQILWHSNKATDFPRTLMFSDFPTATKLYVSSEKNKTPDPPTCIFITSIKNEVQQLQNHVDGFDERLGNISEELSKCFFSNKIHGNNFNTDKIVALPPYFDVNNSEVNRRFGIPISISRDGDVFGWSIDAKMMRKNNENGTATYYISPDGDDTNNNGLTSMTPLKTFTSALVKQDLNTLILLPGVYLCGEHFTSGQIIDAEINIIGVGNVVMKCSSASERPIHIQNSVYVENIVFDGGYDGLKVTMTESMTSVFYKCRFLNATGEMGNGLTALGGNYILEQCEASNNRRDGFNYHKSVINGINYNISVVEINCCGYFNGINDNTYINNGSTIHDSGRIIRIYCEYGFCKGSVVADSNQTKTLNIGVSAFSSMNIDGDEDGRKSNFGAQGGNSIMYLVSCSSFGSLYDCYAEDGNCKIYYDGTFSRPGSVGTGSVDDTFVLA